MRSVGDIPEQPAVTADITVQVPATLTATRFEQVRLFRGWLLPVLKKSISSWVAFTCCA